ncbi:pyruvate formate lyase family protein [Crocosphaera watsonii WH 8501]|uniref:Formate C-acetyltransferase n=1 Tax=Crocosphaera watsonii WH 8501 TaxID=165597 RepID=Q4C394_CROWT|nr:pyruvate formate lyase family protein [Crocosphaera watsonii]EAM50627.1 Formate C-acetyltransferase [Crocosphaera watsonii WH 8501]
MVSNLDLQRNVSTLKSQLTSTQEAWQGFKQGEWVKEVNVRDFIQKNYTPYQGDESFLETVTPATDTLWNEVKSLMVQEREKGVLDAETKIPSSITAYGAGYINQDLEKIVGLQTDQPFKRAIMPFGGIRVVEKSLEAYGYTIDPQTHTTFTEYRKTHNDGVFDAYTSEMRKARHSGIITGLPDAYGRGRIIGDYRRIALYGVDFLIKDKQKQLSSLEYDVMDEDLIRLREEISEQIKALKKLKSMGASYGFDLGNPAVNSQQAIQWTYFGYLAAVKEQNGAAMSLVQLSESNPPDFYRNFRD